MSEKVNEIEANGMEMDNDKLIVKTPNSMDNEKDKVDNQVNNNLTNIQSGSGDKNIEKKSIISMGSSNDKKSAISMVSSLDKKSNLGMVQNSDISNPDQIKRVVLDHDSLSPKLKTLQRKSTTSSKKSSSHGSELSGKSKGSEKSQKKKKNPSLSNHI